MEMIKTIWAENHDTKLDDKALYYCVCQVAEKMKECRAKGIEPPPIIPIVLAMLHFDKSIDDFNTIVDFLIKEKKGLSFLTSKSKI